MLRILRTLLASSFVVLLATPAVQAECTLGNEELVDTKEWTVTSAESGESATYTEYYYESKRVDTLLGTQLTSAPQLAKLRDKVAAGSETNAMVLLNRYLKAEKARDPKSANVANATLVLEHQAGQVFQMSCIESLVLAHALAAYESRKVEINYWLFANDTVLRLYFAIPHKAEDDHTPKRLTLRSDFAKEHLASGELEPFDLRIVGYTQGFTFGEGAINGGELVPAATHLATLRGFAETYSAQIALTNGFDTMSFDSYELGLMTCPDCSP